ncbi:MAG: nucleotide-binding domain containing protein, partial [Pseudomonadota bacterium]
LGVKALKIGPEIEPGVPWTETLSEPPIALALKSGNFGGPNFFGKALEMLR